MVREKLSEYIHPDTKRSAYLKANNVFDCWILAACFNAMIVDGTIDIKWFARPLDIKFNDGLGGVKIIPPKNSDSLIQISQNLYRTALGTCFIAFDEALSDLFGDAQPIEPNNDINSLRIIIYMMRCSFAHNPAEPKWDIHPRYRTLVKIQEIDFAMDFSHLHGKLVSFKQHDGSEGLMKLMAHCLNTIKIKEGYTE